jgi:hypothetical protein
MHLPITTITESAKNSNRKNKVLRTKAALVNEFIEKNKILSKSYTQIQPLEFLEKYFEKIFILKETFGRIEYISTDDLAEHFLYSDVYIYYNNYDKYPKNKLLTDINFLIVDIDGISSKELRQLVNYTLKAIKYKPSYVLNSGSGLHLIYKIENINLQQNYTKYYNYKQFINNVNLALQQRFVHKKLNYKVDIHSITQPYRLPGSTTKFGQQSVLFKVSDKVYNINEIAKWLHVELPKPINKLKNKNKNENRKKYNDNNLLYIPRNNQQFYTWLLGKKDEVVVGNRYMYLFSVAIAAYKTRIPKTNLEKDLYNLVAYFNSRDHIKIKEQEVEKALKGYNNKAVTVRWQTMSNWTGIQSEVKRNYLPRELHLEKCNAIRKINSKAKQQKAVELYNKGYTQKHIANILKVSDRQVRKYLKYNKK